MEERRKFNRWHTAGDEKTIVTCNDAKEVAALTNVSAGGMKLTFSKPISVGSVIWSEVKVLPNTPPFFIKGAVSRVDEKEGWWEAAVEFNQVSTVPIN